MYIFRFYSANGILSAEFLWIVELNHLGLWIKSKEFPAGGRLWYEGESEQVKCALSGKLEVGEIKYDASQSN